MSNRRCAYQVSRLVLLPGLWRPPPRPGPGCARRPSPAHPQRGPCPARAHGPGSRPDPGPGLSRSSRPALGPSPGRWPRPARRGPALVLGSSSGPARRGPPCPCRSSRAAPEAAPGRRPSSGTLSPDWGSRAGPGASSGPARGPWATCPWLPASGAAWQRAGLKSPGPSRWPGGPEASQSSWRWGTLPAPPGRPGGPQT